MPLYPGDDLTRDTPTRDVLRGLAHQLTQHASVEREVADTLDRRADGVRERDPALADRLAALAVELRAVPALRVAAVLADEART